MNLQQLEYILAVDELRHFAKAAEYCNVTQPTLSAMIQKLEDELNTKLFDRTTQPVQPTLTGRKVIEQARITLRQANLIKGIVRSMFVRRYIPYRSPAYNRTLPATPFLSRTNGRIPFLGHQSYRDENTRMPGGTESG